VTSPPPDSPDVIRQPPERAGPAAATVEPPRSAPVQSRMSGKAVVALVFAGLGLLPANIVCAIIGLMLAAMARAAIRSSEGRLTGARVANLALLLSLLGIAIAVVVTWGYAYGWYDLPIE
jgi:hypothetical protein